MPRLPQPGGDAGNWGEILNEFLEQAHEGDGALKDEGILAQKYVKPADGIPASDFHATVQTSLDKADESLNEQGTKDLVVNELGNPESAAARAVNRPVLLGLVAPNPAPRMQIAPLPKIMDTPVTPGAPTRNSSGITNGVLVPYNDDRLRVLGSALTTVNGRGRPLNNVNGYAVDFMFYGSVFENVMRGSGNSACCRVLVDGEWATADYQGGVSGGIAGDDGDYSVLYDFGSASWRHIMIINSATGTNGAPGDWTGVRIGPTDTIRQSPYDAGPAKVVVMGDSQAKGDLTTYHGNAYPFVLARATGWLNIIPVGLSGSGYIGGSGGTWSSRFATDVAAHTPDIVLFVGSSNDEGKDATQLTNACTAIWEQAKALGALVIVVGNIVAHGTPSASAIATRNVIRAAALTSDAVNLWVDVIVSETATANTLGPFTGIGKVGATTGSGNADLARSSDGLHMTDFGNEVFAMFVAEQIKQARANGEISA